MLPECSFFLQQLHTVGLFLIRQNLHSIHHQDREIFSDKCTNKEGNDDNKNDINNNNNDDNIENNIDNEIDDNIEIEIDLEMDYYPLKSLLKILKTRMLNLSLKPLEV